MVDFILILFMLAVFYGGFWCGAKYGTLRLLWAAVKTWFNGVES